MNVVNVEVFRDNQEIERLLVQNKLLKAYEQPIYERFMQGRKGLALLDIGSNDGAKTVDRFSCEAIEQVIGIEFHQELVEQARRNFGNDRFAFYQCDVEGDAFAHQLLDLMGQHQVKAFDVINISFVLLHLKNPAALLAVLRRFLAPGGRLIVIEADDSVSAASGDAGPLCQQFLDILAQDAFSGDRHFGGKVEALLSESGYRQIVQEHTAIAAAGAQTQKKAAIFQTFFSYLPQDVQLLRQQSPHSAQYETWQQWLAQHFDALKRLIMDEHTEISMGVNIITCMGG